ncbi:hypothetical protein C7G41_33900 [Bradyrhizobium sp. MOS002]|nr:hypothetical protein C7G41_33900 [Bradyrhizobium sp. MOS002]
MRLDAANKKIEDYVLLPSPPQAGRYVWISSESLRRQRGVRCAGREELIIAIMEKLAKSNHVVPTKSVPPNKQTKQGRPKAKGSGGRRLRCEGKESLR